MEYLIYDGVVVAVLALFVWLGWRRGLLLSLCGLAAAAAAFLGAGFLADTLDEPVANALAPKLESAIEESVAPHYDDNGPGGAVDALREDKGLFGWCADAVETAVEENALLPLSELVSTAAQSLAQQVSHSLIFALAFLALYILLTLLLHALDLVAKLPGLHFCNGLGGGVIGLAKGGLIVFVAVAALMCSAWRPDAQTLERSYVFRFFVEHNPILPLFAG